MELESLIKKYSNCNDRFTFDYLFRNLLHIGYSHEEAKDIILYNCSLSAITIQERICNGFYKTIKKESLISEDLQQLKNDIYNSLILKDYFN